MRQGSGSNWGGRGSGPARACSTRDGLPFSSNRRSPGRALWRWASGGVSANHRWNLPEAVVPLGSEYRPPDGAAGDLGVRRFPSTRWWPHPSEARAPDWLSGVTRRPAEPEAEAPSPKWGTRTRSLLKETRIRPHPLTPSPRTAHGYAMNRGGGGGRDLGPPGNIHPFRCGTRVRRGCRPLQGEGPGERVGRSRGVLQQPARAARRR
jgi:hypothetical protein